MKRFIEVEEQSYGIPREIEYMKRNRKCIKCRKKLSRYNLGDQCLHHIPDDKEKVERNAYGQHGRRFA